jgi:ribosomal protein L37AE/L43A
MKPGQTARETAREILEWRRSCSEYDVALKVQRAIDRELSEVKHKHSQPEKCISCGKSGELYAGSSGWWCNWCGYGGSFDDYLASVTVSDPSAIVKGETKHHE